MREDAEPHPELLSGKQAQERLQIFMASAEYLKLQLRGRSLAGKSEGLKREDFWAEPMKSRWAGPEMQEWRKWVYREAHAQGLAGWAVELACLLDDEDPGPFLMAPTWRAARAVTPFDDQRLLNRLLYWSFELIKTHGIQVQVGYSKDGQEHQVVVPYHQLYVPHGRLKIADRPDRDRVITMHTWFPPTVPSDELITFTRQVRQVGQELLRKLGYEVPERVRTTTHAAEARALKLNRKRLKRRGTGDIVEDGLGPEEFDHLSDDERKKRMKRVADTRHRLKGRKDPAK